MVIQRKKIKPFIEVELDREDDGRWIAEIPKLPGVMAYGRTKQAALRTVYAVALRTLADKVEHGRALLQVSHLFNHDVADR